MLVLVLLLALVLVAVVAAATIAAVRRDGYGAVAERRAYDSRHPHL